MESTQNGYVADDIEVLEGLEAVRKRPAMYIGDVGVRGLHHLVFEVVDNSIDEALAGYCTCIEVTLHKDGAVTVQDDGRGIPVGVHKEMGLPALEVVMTMLHAGGKFDKNVYKVSGGLHGVGISCVNGLASSLRAEIRREGYLWEQEYIIGVPTAEVRRVRPLEPGEGTGTQIWFKPDEDIFTETTDLRYDTLAERLRELAYLNAGLTITLEDQRDLDSEKEQYKFEGGIKEFVAYLDEAQTPIHSEVILLEDTKAGVEVAMRYNTRSSTNVRSFANNIRTHDGGTHVSGFRKALTRTLKHYADSNNLVKSFKGELIGDDFREGLTAVLSVMVGTPQFEGQTKGKLGNSEVAGVVEGVVTRQIKTWLDDHPAQARQIVKKGMVAAQARIAAKKARELVVRKNAFASGGLPGKLADCASRNPEECEVYLVEGDSAGGSAKQARDRHSQAILPLRGKILNVEKARLDRVLTNEEIKNIITALGTGIATSGEFRYDNLRYHRILIMTDADVDGAHIRTLLLTFFYRHLQPLVESGHVYIALPPLYRAKQGSTEKYCWTEAELETTVGEMQEARRGKVSIQRYKGLGEMNPEQLWNTTMDPVTRKLQVVTIEDAASADRIFSTLMGDAVEPRRKFIERNARYATLDI